MKNKTAQEIYYQKKLDRSVWWKKFWTDKLWDWLGIIIVGIIVTAGFLVFGWLLCTLIFWVGANEFKIDLDRLKAMSKQDLYQKQEIIWSTPYGTNITSVDYYKAN